MTTRVLSGDCRDVLPTLAAGSVHCVVTSPPYYGLRDYGTAQWDGGEATCDHRHHIPQGIASSSTLRPEGRPHHHLANGEVNGLPFRDICGKCGARRIDRQIGLEATPDEYLQTLVAVFREVRRVLRDDGTLWLNMGDSYAGGPSHAHDGIEAMAKQHRSIVGKPKDLLMMPARLALALQADGWWIRSDIIWAKPNPMPESCQDRPTSAHEHVFLLSRAPRYYYDADAVREEAEYGFRPTRGGNIFDRVGSGASAPVKTPGVITHGGDPSTGRNLRNVWTIATAPFSEWTPQIELVPVPASEALARAASTSAGGGDIARITSPDCPSHAGQPDRVPTGFCDGLSEAQLTSIRGTGARPAQGMPSGSSTIRRTPVLSQSRPSTSGCSHPEGAEIATPHSSESHRTGPGPLFSERAISSDGTASDTLRTEPGLLRLASSGHDTAENRSGNGSFSSPLPEMVAGSVHSSSSACRCGYWRKVTTKTSHFATFPPALAETCIKAGTSERGCCAQCGAPWVRQVSIERVPHPQPPGRGGRQTVTGSEITTPSSMFNSGLVPISTTTGWLPGCRCDAPTQPCTVLDPFAGAGTTMLVADRLQRHAIGIELSEAYAAMARNRITDDAPLLAEVAD